MDADHTFVETLADRNRPRQRGRATSRLWLLAVLLLIVVGAGVWVFLRPSPTEPTNGSFAPPVSVTAVAALTASLPVTLEALGTVTPLATVTVKPRVDGHLVEVGFREGQNVRTGDFVALIDPRPYQAALAQAEGQLARDQALLRNAEIDVIRYRQLVAEDSIARQQLDTQESLVSQYRATVKVDQAQVETARLNLGYCRITAPLDGRTGLRLVDQGNYVQAGEATGIVVITQLQPITVVFTIPQDDLPPVLARLNGGAKLPVDAYDRAGLRKLASGVLTTVDNRIDPSTGTIKLKAEFDNADEQLYPNQFVNVRLLVDTAREITVVPSSAVQRGSKGTYVYVVGPDATVVVRPVKTGLTDKDRTQITAGIEPGERVVTDGVDRLRDGLRVSLADPLADDGAGPHPPAPAATGGPGEGRKAPARR